MVVGVALAPHHLGAQRPQTVLEALGRGDARQRADRLALQPFERKLLAAPHVLEDFGRVVAFDDFGGLVVFADFRLDRFHVAAAFGEEDDVGALQMPGRFAQNAARQHVAVAERIGGIDQHHLDRMLELLVLEAIVQNDGVAPEAFDGVAPGLDPVAIHQHGDARQIGGEHVGFVAADGRIEKDVAAVRHHERRIDHLGKHAAVPRRLFAAIAARKDGYLAALGAKRAREDFGNRGFAGAAGGHVADGDHLDAQRETA